MTQRIRSKTFACLLRQEIAYFDRPENSSGAISTRLSSEALAVQQMTGTRLGIICESLALSVFGLMFGIFFNWQLTLIVFIIVVINVIIAFLNIRLEVWHNQQSNLILSRTSSVSTRLFIYEHSTCKKAKISYSC